QSPALGKPNHRDQPGAFWIMRDILSRIPGEVRRNGCLGIGGGARGRQSVAKCPRPVWGGSSHAVPGSLETSKNQGFVLDGRSGGQVGSGLAIRGGARMRRKIQCSN